MGALKRTESCLSLFDCSGSSLASSNKEGTPIPYTRTLQYQQDQRAARRKLAANRSMAADNLTTLSQRVSSPETKPLATLSRRGAPQQSPTPSSRPNRTSRPRTPTGVASASPSKGRSTPPTKLILPSANSPHAVAIYVTQRTSSPLSPTKTYLPDRPVFPRSKAEPDLYKKALIGRMKTSDEGRKVLTMGPRLAISIWMATKDLEKMVEDTYQRERDLDIIMGDTSTAPSSIEPTPAPPVLTNSWVVVKPSEDWEMVDCSA